jgi:hypothetical protein
MSYCRFSNDDFQCDVYCYEDIRGGYTTHVARSRLVFDGPLPEKVPLEDFGAWCKRHEVIMNAVRDAERKAIGLPFDGEEFSDPTAAECASRLEWLRGLGYNVPQYAIDSLREEAEEESKK